MLKNLFLLVLGIIALAIFSSEMQSQATVPAPTVTITPQLSSDPALLQLFATYRTASGNIASSRDIAWVNDSPEICGLSQVPGRSRWRYVHVKGLQIGTCKLTAKAIVSSIIYEKSVVVAVVPQQLLRPQIVDPALLEIDTILVYPQFEKNSTIKTAMEVNGFRILDQSIISTDTALSNYVQIRNNMSISSPSQKTWVLVHTNPMFAAADLRFQACVEAFNMQNTLLFETCSGGEVPASSTFFGEVVSAKMAKEPVFVTYLNKK